MRRVRPIIILAIGWAIFVAYGWPGLMTMDSFDQLGEARAWFFTDSHPPAMAALWGILDRIMPGPTPMLVLQGTAFLAGIYLVLRKTFAPQRAAVAAVVLLLFPPVLAPMVVIWKDCLMAGFLVLGVALIEERPGLALGAFFVATAMRYNAPAATLPLVVLLLQPWGDLPWLRRYAIAAAAWVAITASAFGLNALLTDRQMHFWASSFALQDIVGTVAHVDEPLPDAELAPLLAPTGIRIDHDYQATLRTHYKRGEFTHLLAGDAALWSMPIAGLTPAPEPQREAIGHAWWELVTRHPGAFVAYRLETFGEILGVYEKFGGTTVIRHRYQTPELLDKLGLARGQAAWQENAERWLLSLAKRTPLFRPHLYALIAVFLLGFAWRQRDTLALLLSGLLMELTTLPLGATPDYRYSHWLVTCTCLALAIVVARRARSGDIARV